MKNGEWFLDMELNTEMWCIAAGFIFEERKKSFGIIILCFVFSVGYKNY